MTPATILVVASGVTEYQALPHLLRDFTETTGRNLDIPFPPGHQALDPNMAARLIKAGYWGSFPRPEKAVVLVDCDGAERGVIQGAMQTAIGPLLRDLTDRGLAVLVATAKWHLEAWVFADVGGLEHALGRSLGGVDVTNPDAMENPKQHLKNLLRSVDRVYTAAVAEGLARVLDPVTVRERSLSFAAFEAATANGGH